MDHLKSYSGPQEEEDDVPVETEHLRGWRQKDIPDNQMEDRPPENNLWIEDKDKYYEKKRPHFHVATIPESLRTELIEMLMKLEPNLHQRIAYWKVWSQDWNVDRITFDFSFKPF